MTKRVIRGKIARIISDQELVLNRGSEHGVEEGMYFRIIDPAPIQITDPDTGENLGDVQLIKVVVRAVEVAPRLTLARTFRTKSINVGGAGMRSGVAAAINDMMKPPQYVKQVERLRIDPAKSEPLGPSEGIVDIGDPFESAVAEDAEIAQSVTVWE